MSDFAIVGREPGRRAESVLAEFPPALRAEELPKIEESVSTIAITVRALIAGEQLLSLDPPFHPGGEVE